MTEILKLKKKQKDKMAEREVKKIKRHKDRFTTC